MSQPPQAARSPGMTCVYLYVVRLFNTTKNVLRWIIVDLAPARDATTFHVSSGHIVASLAGARFPSGERSLGDILADQDSVQTFQSNAQYAQSCCAYGNQADSMPSAHSLFAQTGGYLLFLT